MLSNEEEMTALKEAVSLSAAREKVALSEQRNALGAIVQVISRNAHQHIALMKLTFVEADNLVTCLMLAMDFSYEICAVVWYEALGWLMQGCTRRLKPTAWLQWRRSSRAEWRRCCQRPLQSSEHS